MLTGDMPDRVTKRLVELIEPLRVPPGTKVKLAKDHDPGYTAGWLEKREDTYGLLVILQALDAGGKDGTIRHVMSGVNPQGVLVHSFKVPSEEELSHDFLWRYAMRVPARGQIGIFNRSHYEEVLVVRVHPELLARQRLPEAALRGDVWKRRYRAINDWERHLVESGFRIVKLFLNISREEQRKRFLKRIDRPEKNWKFSAADVNERAHWDAYQHAFQAMLTNTSTPWAPWFVIPADHKWFAHLAAGAAVLSALREIDPRYPTVAPEARAALLQAKAELDAQAPDGAASGPDAGGPRPPSAARRARRRVGRSPQRPPRQRSPSAPAPGDP
jgi:PPK2 family polyphosphate:nucleotide phosphotransferase